MAWPLEQEFVVQTCRRLSGIFEELRLDLSSVKRCRDGELPSLKV